MCLTHLRLEHCQEPHSPAAPSREELGRSRSTLLPSRRRSPRIPWGLHDNYITLTIVILTSVPAQGNTIPYIGEELTGLPKSGDSQGNVGNQEVALASGQAGKGGSLQFLRAATSNWLEASKKRTKTTFAPWPWWDWPPCYWGSPQPGQRRQMSHWPQPFRLQLGILKLLRLY